MTVLAVTTAEHVTAGIAGALLLAAAVVLVRRFDRAGAQPVQPLTVLFAGWGLTLVLFALAWVDYIDSPVTTYVAVYGSILAFAVGAAIAYRLVGREPKGQPSPERLRPGRIRLLWAICLGLGLAGFGAYLRAVDAVLGWQTLFDNLGLVRDAQTTSRRFDELYGPWRLLTYFDLVAFVLWTVGLRARAFAGRWRFAAPLGLLSLAPFAFTGERTLLGTMIVWTVFLHILWKPPQLRRLFVGAAGVAAFLVAAFLVLASMTSKTIDNHPEIESSLASAAPRDLALGYVYITGNIPTFTRLTEDPIAPDTGGAMTALPLVKALHAAGIGGEPPEEVGAFYPIPFETFNNLAWLGTFYLDFGLAGCLILPLLLGAAATAVTQVAQRGRTLLGAWTGGLVLYVVAFTPLNNKLSTTLTWQFLLLGPVLVPLLRDDGRGLLDLSRWRPRLRAGWTRSRRAYAAGAATVAAAAAFLAVVPTDNHGPPEDSRELAARLADTARNVVASERAGTLAEAPALASQLHVANPAMRYQHLPSYIERPAEVNAVGVFLGDEDAWLWARAPDGKTLGSHVVFDGPLEGVHPQRGRVRNLLEGGSLEVPVTGPWQISPSPAASVRSASGSSLASDASLRVKGRRRPAPNGGTFVTQVVRRLPRRARGSTYTFRFHSRSARLNRALPAAMRFTYADGSTEFFDAGGGTSGTGAEPAIRRETDNFWDVATAVGTAAKRLRSIQVYLVDTGASPLRGAVWLDAASLAYGDRAVTFPAPR